MVAILPEQVDNSLSPAIAVQDLCKHFGRLVTLRGVDFTVHRGEIFGLIGPDGADKTTIFQILAGVMESTKAGTGSGSVATGGSSRDGILNAKVFAVSRLES